MATPVFVIHGTSNRDPGLLLSRVDHLRQRLEGRWELYPVFWGELGTDADHTLVGHAVPGSPEVRGTGPVDEDLESLAVALAAGSLTEADRLDMVAHGVRQELDRRGLADDDLMDQITEALMSAWTNELFWLWHVSDPALLGEVGASIAAEIVTDTNEIEVRGERLDQLVRKHLTGLDGVVGAAFGAAGERVNRWIRVGMAAQIAGNFGDIITYQRRQREIHDHVRSVISDVDPRLGRSPEHPVHLIGHSLGATIALDLATVSEDTEPGPVWTDAVVTFGSLWPLFHLCDPRSSALRPYTGQPVVLPRSVHRWTNLWEPLDPFAYVAAKMFTLADGTPPRDVEVKHWYSSGLGTHSSYWEAPQLVSELVKVFDTA